MQIRPDKLKYPNPGFVRTDFTLLDGLWDFDFDDQKQFTVPVTLGRTIQVPFTYESIKSGIGDTRIHPVVWYQRSFFIKPHTGKILMHFEAVDYSSHVYVNNRLVYEHVGGYTAFKLDITDFVTTGKNLLTVKVEDDLSQSHLRGKQRWKPENYDCWYVQTTGIWKSVWIEYCGSHVIDFIRFYPSNDGHVVCKVQVSGGDQVSLNIKDLELTAPIIQHKAEFSFKINDPQCWSIDNPMLYDALVTLPGEVADRVECYFAFREVSARKEGFFLNDQKVYLRMVLDQGYWADSMLTAPDKAALKADVEQILHYGFNGVRKHQKIESYAFYYLCDCYGLLVWGEIPSAYEFSEQMRQELRRDLPQILKQLSPFVSIVTWVVFNESWGIPEVSRDEKTQQFVKELSHLVREQGGQRLISVNDGWSQMDGDILSLHEYEQNPTVFAREYADVDYVLTDKIINGIGKALVPGIVYTNQPVIISEMGGISLESSNGWGYGEKARSETEYIERFRGLLDTIRKIPYIQGYCYTQFTDVQQESNGLMTIDRLPKIEPKIIREIILDKGEPDERHS